MKKLFTLFFLSISATCLFGQSIKYQKSLDDALTLASKSHKPVFILINPLTPSPIPPNLPEHVNFSTGLDAKEVIDHYNQKFICYKANMMDSAGNKIRNQYHLTIFPAYIFLDDKGQIVYRGGMNSSNAKTYMDMADEALGRIASGKTISYYDQLYKNKRITAEQLKDYITLRETLKLFDNADLADEYVNFLTIKSFDDYNTVLFILKAGPYAYGKAYNLCFTNRKITDSIYKNEPIQVRTAINNHIILNTRSEAIKTKNILLAQNCANFSSNIWSKNFIEANKSLIGEMLIYYKAVKDTLNYYSRASYYYEAYYLKISADSARKLQQKILENAKSAVKTNKDYIPPSPGGTVTKQFTAMQIVPGSQPVANVLNNAAYDFYTMGTHNTDYLIKALVWCRRAIELQPIYGYYDTMAHIMYRLNFYDEAILNQNKAVEMAASLPQVNATEQDHLKRELEKMKAHEL
jgi:tetratricopeptide (TPR) repeat protein